MIITLSNGTQIELSSNEMAELAKHSVDMFSTMATKSMAVEQVVPAAPVAAVKTRAPKGSVLKMIRKHHHNNKIDCKHKIYAREVDYRRRHGHFSWESVEA